MTQPTYPMVTQSKDEIFKPKYRAEFTSLGSITLHKALLMTTVPKGFKFASKYTHWQTAMHNEMAALQANNTLELVPRPSTSNVMSSKWIFNTKFNSDSTIEIYKARLVAHGFT